MKEPEIKAWNRVVVARITQIQKAQHLFIDKKEPQKSMVLAGAAMQAEVEIGRVSQRGKNVPGRGNQKGNHCAADWMEPFPRFRGEQLPGQKQIDHASRQRKEHSNQALDKQSGSHACGEYRRPNARMLFLIVQRPKNSPHCKRDG